MDEKNIKGLSIRVMNAILAIGTALTAIALIASLFILTSKYRAVQESNKELNELSASANSLEVASDYLTEQVRYYVVTGEKDYYDNYMEEAFVTKRRDKSLEVIKANIEDNEAISDLEKALNESNALMQMEYYAFKLVVLSNGYNINDYEVIKDVVISDEDLALSALQKQNKAIELVFSAEYNQSKDTIATNVNSSVEKIINESNSKFSKADDTLINTMIFQQAMVTIMIVFLITAFFIIYFRLVLPLDHGVELILQGNDLKIEGMKEYKLLSNAYNVMKEKNRTNKERLTYEVEHDGLTGLYNRHGYDSLYHNLNLERTAYVLIDVDNFKKINDKYGHAIGDKVLKKVGNVLRKHFRSDDYLCRIGGDEFAVLLSDCSEDIAPLLREKTDKINVILQTKDGDLPPVSLSVGVAFGNEHDDTDSLFKKADIALYHTKREGRNGVSIFDSSQVFATEQ